MLSLSLEKELLSRSFGFSFEVEGLIFLLVFTTILHGGSSTLTGNGFFPLPFQVKLHIGLVLILGYGRLSYSCGRSFLACVFFVVWFWVLQMEELLDSCQHKDVFRWKKQWWLANHEPWMPINDSLPLLMASGGCFPWWLILLWKSLLPFLCCLAFLDRQSSDAHFSCNKFCSSFAPKGPRI